jgi:hypothetical protein
MTTTDQRACEVCGELGGYRIANTNPEDPEAGEMYVVRSPPWYRDEVNPKTNRPTGKRECAYRGGARCRDCANRALAELKKLTDSPKCKRYPPPRQEGVGDGKEKTRAMP